MKSISGIIFFLGGLEVLIVASVKDKPIGWFMFGAVGLLVGLELIIDDRIDVAKRKMLGGVD